MARRYDRKQLTVVFSEEQYDTLKKLAPGLLSVYVRSLIMRDAERRGIKFPDNLPPAGTYERKSN